MLGFADLDATVVEGSVLAARPALFADLARALGRDRQSEQLVLVLADRARQLAIDGVVGGQREVRRADAELQREIERRWRLPAARDADQDHLGLGEVARRRTVVVRLREVDRLHPREVFVGVGDAVRAARRVRALHL